jgi:NitT/TauT family transport system substrate-binding protein
MSRLALGIVSLLCTLAACAPAASSPAAKPAPATAAPAAPAGAASAPAGAPAAPTASAAAATPAALTTVTVATVGSVSDSGIFIGMDRGYFAAQGIQVELAQTQGGGQVIPSLSTGQLDVAGATTAAGFFNAWNRDIPIRVVADKGRIAPGYSYMAMAVRKDLADSGAIRTPADLRGRRIAVNLANLGSVGDPLTAKLLARAGLPPDAVELVDLPYPDMNAAFGSQSIDVAMHLEPLITAAEARGIAARWLALDELSPNHQISTLLYSPQFGQTEAARGFMLAYVRGLRDYNDAFTHDRDRAAMIDLLTRYTTVKDAAMFERMAMAGLDPDGRVNQASVAEDLDFYIRNGYVQQRLDVADVIDNRYVDYAVERLGPYRP